MLKAQQKYNQNLLDLESVDEPILNDDEILPEEKSEPTQDDVKISAFLVPISVLLFSIAGFLIYFAYTEGVGGGAHVRSGIR